MANGGYAALMDLLLNRDLSKFDAEDIPETGARLAHKLNAADDGDKVVIAFADDGRLPGAVAGTPHIARSAVLLPAMRDRGAWRRKPGDLALTNFLKRWDFEKADERDYRAWAAAGLPELRKLVEQRFPAATWADPLLTEWLPGEPLPVDRAQRDYGGDHGIF